MVHNSFFQRTLDWHYLCKMSSLPQDNTSHLANITFSSLDQNSSFDPRVCGELTADYIRVGVKWRPYF